MSKEIIVLNDSKLIPAVHQYWVAADPNDPTSRDTFVPWKLSLDKGGKGAFKLEHKGASEPIIAKQLEVIFLTNYPNVQCKASERADKDSNTICWSLNREYSHHGFDCKKECPYAEENVPKEEKKYRRPLRKAAVILARPKGSEGPFMVVRYISVLNNVTMLEGLKQEFTQMIPNILGGDRAYTSASVGLITATVETDKSFKIGRFEPAVHFVAHLDIELEKKVAKIIGALIELNNSMLDRFQKRALEAREQRLLKEVATEQEVFDNNPVQSTIEDLTSEIPKEKVVEEVKEKPAPRKKESKKSVEETTAAQELEEVFGPDDGDDDIPF